MRVLYLDIFSGISGDMFLGAMIDLGLDMSQFEGELKKLPLDDYHCHVSRGSKASISGVKFDVHVTHDHHHHGHEHTHHEEEAEHHQHHGHSHHHHHGEEEHSHEHHEHGPEEHDHHHHGRCFADIKHLILEGTNSDWVKQKSIAVFERIAEAEGKIHGVAPDQVHFHEVGAVDSIVDIVGGCIAIELLGKPRILAGHVVEGTGWIDCAHGRFPIPAPATLAILGGRGIAVSQCNEPHELITPTGAALLAEFAESFGPMQNLVADKIGFGLGQRDNETRPNVLRAILGEATQGSSSHDWLTDTITVLQANLDDLNPEILGYFVEKAFAAGALDVFYTPVQMKKNRPGSLLTLLCAETDADRLSELILKETSTFGVRRSIAERRKLARKIISVQTPYGAVQVKIGKMDGKVVHAAPEFESCKKLAEQASVSLKQIYDAALRAAK